ncbi:MAG: DEAD/DEAH box helicase [Phycisphaerae bacterium]|nr:DEAD/DEAH box helicase [Phycisphaerae bacterium]
MPFSTLRLSAPLLRSLADEGYETPTPIQSKAIPAILEGRDLLGCAQTGTGKTAAFALPIIHRLHAVAPDPSRRAPVTPRALILSPTRELAAQIGESFRAYGRHAGLTHAVVFGGVSQFHQVRALRNGVDILVATPGRLMDLMNQRVADLTRVSIFVLDEADRMLDMGFIQPIRRIAAALPRPRQTLLFSATMPRAIAHLADSLLKDPVRVAVTPVASAAPLIEQSVYMLPPGEKQALLQHLLRGGESGAGAEAGKPGRRTVTRALVFTKTKHGADRLCRNLDREGIPAVAIHGNKAQNYRTRALEAFRKGACRVLVATDVAARGLDVDGISHVFNFDLPMEPEAYIHRIGRTGRAGAAGIAISFCDPHERDLLRAIQRLTGKPIPVAPRPADMPATAHAAPHAAQRDYPPAHHATRSRSSPDHAPAKKPADRAPRSSAPHPRAGGPHGRPGHGAHPKTNTHGRSGAPGGRPRPVGR